MVSGRAAKDTGQDRWLTRHTGTPHHGRNAESRVDRGRRRLHVLDGRVRVQAEGQWWDLGPGDLIVLGENLHEPVIDEAAFIVTVAWPAGAGASEHRGVGRSR